MTRVEKNLAALSLTFLTIGIISLGFILWITVTSPQESYCERTTNLCWDLTAIVDNDPNTDTIWEYNRK